MRNQGRNLGLPQVVWCRFCLFIRQEVLKVTRPVSTLRTAWTKLRDKAKVVRVEKKLVAAWSAQLSALSLSTVLDRSPYSWGFAASQCWRIIVLRSGTQRSSPCSTNRTCAQSQPSLCRARELAALPPLAPYQRCTCGSCRDNAKWDRVFAKFEVKEQEVRADRTGARLRISERTAAAGTALLLRYRGKRAIPTPAHRCLAARIDPPSLRAKIELCASFCSAGREGWGKPVWRRLPGWNSPVSDTAPW